MTALCCVESPEPRHCSELRPYFWQPFWLYFESVAPKAPPIKWASARSPGKGPIEWACRALPNRFPLRTARKEPGAERAGTNWGFECRDYGCWRDVRLTP